MSKKQKPPRPDDGAMARDVDGDGTPEALFNLFTGGAHCCEVTYLFRGTTEIEHNFTYTRDKRKVIVNDRMLDSLEHFDPVTFTRLNLDFHGVLFEHCPNAHVLELVHRGWARLRALRESTFSFVPGRAQGSVDEHSHLLDLIERRADPLDIELADIGSFKSYPAIGNRHRSKEGNILILLVCKRKCYKTRLA